MGLVDQVQVNVAEAQLLHRGLNGLLGTLVAGILNPQLGGDKEFFPGNPTLSDGSAYRLLVHIGGCRVNEAVTHINGIQHRLLTLDRVRHLKDPEALHGHLYAVL